MIVIYDKGENLVKIFIFVLLVIYEKLYQLFYFCLLLLL